MKVRYRLYLNERERKGQTSATAIHNKRPQGPSAFGMGGIHPAYRVK